jgi:pimeloyl-ACP methyl ester carboxylesterase
MPKVRANKITMNYEQQGSGEALLLLPFLSADHACYAFQVGEYAKHFICISLDLRGTGETEKSEGKYSTQDLADDAAAFLHAIGARKAHIAGLSLGGGIGLWLAANPDGPIREGGDRSLPSHGEGVAECPRDDNPGDFPVVFYARAICVQARVYSVPGRFRSEPPRTASLFLPAAVKCCVESRCVA